MGYNAKNYTEQGGEKTVIGGTLEILPGAKVIGLEIVIPQATESKAGVVRQCSYQKHCDGTEGYQVAMALNELIDRLTKAGIMAMPTEKKTKK